MSELGIPGSGINPVESEHTGQALPCLSQLTPVFGSQPCPGYCCVFHPCSLENEPGAGFYPRAKPEGWLSPKPSPCCAPAPLSAHRSCLLFIPTVLDSLRNFSPGRGRHLSLNQNLSGSRTEAPTSKAASAFRAALLAACLPGSFEIPHGDGHRGRSELQKDALEWASLGNAGGAGGSSIPAPWREKKNPPRDAPKPLDTSHPLCPQPSPVFSQNSISAGEGWGCRDSRALLSECPFQPFPKNHPSFGTATWQLSRAPLHKDH